MMFEDKEIHFMAGGRMRSSIYIRSFVHLENAWQAQSTKKMTVLAMGTSLWGAESTAGFWKRAEA